MKQLIDWMTWRRGFWVVVMLTTCVLPLQPYTPVCFLASANTYDLDGPMRPEFAREMDDKLWEMRVFHLRFGSTILIRFIDPLGLLLLLRPARIDIAEAELWARKDYGIQYRDPGQPPNWPPDLRQRIAESLREAEQWQRDNPDAHGPNIHRFHRDNSQKCTQDYAYYIEVQDVQPEKRMRFLAHQRTEAGGDMH